MARVFVDRTKIPPEYRVENGGAKLLTTDRRQAEAAAGPWAHWHEIAPIKAPEPFCWGGKKERWRLG